MIKNQYKEIDVYSGEINIIGLTPITLIPLNTVIYNFSHCELSITNDSHAFQVSEKEYIKDPDFISKINHSCEPNLIVDIKSKTCKTIKNISPGDILTYFYPSTEWILAKPFQCQCGTELCLNTINGFKFLSYEMKMKYFINDFLLCLKN